MIRNLVGWFEIYVDDMERAKKFYESVFQQKTVNLVVAGEDMEMWAFEGDDKVYGAPGALVKMEGFKAGGSSVIVYFSCEDCSVEEKRVLEFGGRMVREKFPIGEHGFCSLVYDTEGNMIGLHSMK